METLSHTPRIKRLSPTVAERIAAGEVIERPSSVVKELLENSLDSGATEIAIHLEQGGKSLIEILDNGNGMLPEDLELCVERHATSKLSSLEDLESITTLGFRGEALASIAAVTDLEIVSRAKESSLTHELVVGDLTGRLVLKPQAKKITFGHFLNTQHGTRIQARGLFSQIPARLKFLKSQNAEVSQIREWVERLAMAHPQVGFTLTSEDRTILSLAPAAESDRVQAILGDQDNHPLITASNEQDGFRDVGLKLRLHWIQGLSSPQSRKVVAIVNGRALKDRLIQQAILAPFRQLLLPGQFPAVALFIEVNPAAIDVNVHPTKTEIRFLDSKKLFSAVGALVKTCVARQGAPARAHSFVAREIPYHESMPHETPPMENWKAAELPMHFSHSRRATAATEPDTTTGTKMVTEPWTATETVEEPAFNTPSETASATETTRPARPQPSFVFEGQWIGSVLDTYLIYQNFDELVLIDQHAAHERVRYEKLKKRILGSPDRSATLSSQALLMPETIRFSRDQTLAVHQRLSWMTALGFEAELLSEDCLVVRAIPVEWGTQGLKIRLKNFLDRLLQIEEFSLNSLPEALIDEPLFEALASEACHSSVRAGDPLEPKECQELVRLLFECEHPWNCPHGRPTVVKVPKGKIEEWFLRKV